MSNVTQFVDAASANKSSARFVVERLLCNRDTFAAIIPYFDPENEEGGKFGGVCGHKVMDLKAAVDVIHNADVNSELSAYKLNDFKLGNVLKNALRTRFNLNKAWKIDGLNKKLTSKAASPETNSANAE